MTTRWYRFNKRALDLAVAAPLALLSLPVQAVVALAVGLRLGRPILFRQVRPGLHAQPFTLLKFRTMHHLDPARGRVDDASRLDGFGAWLRASSLDELPSLWNVVRGDLSLVGPRPLLVSYLQRYSPEQARRHDVPPGLTGLAQVNGRNATTWEERLRWDVAYVDRACMRLDLHILARTVGIVLSRHGVNAPGEATMPEFQPQPCEVAPVRIGAVQEVS
ncbi:sugar transferase [Gephyromycinifex aptenodytis]|uniref:sugar transferase n=1 Tax=Gephyromycinifex aptenodytis TaxID=2716227 RepID=UPI001448231D|nr:sugar transferase [Gephyromycinifex aptenodytis]